MKLDPTMMKTLLQMNDAALWQKIREIAIQNGISLSETPPPPAEMERLRSLVAGCGQSDVAQAMQTLSRYRRKG